MHSGARRHPHTFILFGALAVLTVHSGAARACPVTATFRYDFPQSFNLCGSGLWSPQPTGIERTLVPPPDGATIVKARLHATFVSTSLCSEGFDAGHLMFLLARPDGTEWVVHAGTDLGWSGTGTFATTIESDVLNGPAGGGFWHDLYFAAVEMRVSGHFHNSVTMPDCFWELEYIDTAAVDGDVNCDGRVNYEDIGAFALALVNPDAYAAENPECHPLSADMDCNALLDGNDVQLFTDHLLFAVPLTGRCCLNDGSCEELWDFECDGEGGLFGGIWTECGEGACPLSTPAITSVTFPTGFTNCDGDAGNTAFMQIHGDGFHPEAFVELTQAGQDPVWVFNAVQQNRTLIDVVGGLRLGCLPAPGSWDVVVTNPDGESAALANAVTVDPCPVQPFVLDDVVFTPIEVLTCPGEDLSSPQSQLVIDLFGTNLPPDFTSGNLDSQVWVNLVDDEGSEWISAHATQVELIQPGHFRVTFLISHGNQPFPTSNPPAGTYSITLEGCTQSVQSADSVVIREECPSPPEP